MNKTHHTWSYSPIHEQIRTMNNDTHPELCNHCKPLVESSKLEWIKLGGQSVSIPKKPLHWVLRDKYSDDVINANANYSQQLAAKSRELITVTEQRDEACRLAEKYRNLSCDSQDEADETLLPWETTNPNEL
jgi:hypothetical protein